MKFSGKMAVIAVALSVSFSAFAAADASAPASAEQFVPVLNYKMGPYAGSGSSMFQGYMDYMALVNARDGGVHGVKLSFEECETEYLVGKTVECYQKFKDRNPSAVAVISTGGLRALQDVSAKDQIPLISISAGPIETQSGEVFKYMFPLHMTYANQGLAKVAYIAEREGGWSNLKGKSIMTIYHDSDFGRAEIPVLQDLAKKHGFTLILAPVQLPGMKQDEQWSQVRLKKPDWVMLQAWGAMTSSALRYALEIGYPLDKMLGGNWSASVEDLAIFGEGAKGYTALTVNAEGKQFPVMQDILKHVYKASTPPRNFGSTYYNRGVMMGAILVEAVKTAQEKYGKGNVLSPDQVRWGLENVNLTAEKLASMGTSGMFSPMATSCDNHEGGGGPMFYRWDGKNWSVVPFNPKMSASERDIPRSKVVEIAGAYAKSKGIMPRNCSAEK